MYPIQNPNNFHQYPNGNLGGIHARSASEGRALALQLISGDTPATKDLKERIANGKSKPADHEIFCKTFVNNTTLKLHELFPEEKKFVHNLKDLRVKAKTMFLCTGLSFQSAEATPESPTNSNDARLRIAAYESIDATATHTAIAAGLLSLRVNTAVKLTEFPLQNFLNENRKDMPKGYMPLDNPFIVLEDQQIVPEIEIPALTGLTANTAIRMSCLGFMFIITD